MPRIFPKYNYVWIKNLVEDSEDSEDSREWMSSMDGTAKASDSDNICVNTEGELFVHYFGMDGKDVTPNSFFDECFCPSCSKKPKSSKKRKTH